MRLVLPGEADGARLGLWLPLGSSHVEEPGRCMGDSGDCMPPCVPPAGGERLRRPCSETWGMPRRPRLVKVSDCGLDRAACRLGRYPGRLGISMVSRAVARPGRCAGVRARWGARGSNSRGNGETGRLRPRG